MNRGKLIIGIAGLQRAGKTTVGTYLKIRRGALLLSNSQLLRALLQTLAIAVSRGTLASLGEALFGVFGRDVLARAHAVRIESDETPPLVVVDGLRFPEEVFYYRNRFGDAFRLMFVLASDDVRYARALAAGEPEKSDERTLTPEQFRELQSRITEAYANELQLAADAVVLNEGSIEMIHTTIDRVISEWQRSR